MFTNYKDWTKAIHKEGHIFVVIFSVVTFLLASINGSLGWIGFTASCWCIYFFRNPDRLTPTLPNLVISPADGIIQSIVKVKLPSELQTSTGITEDMLRVSVFLNVMNVHVNRIPCDGKITNLHYHPGRFFNASLDKASIHNERQSVMMETTNGTKVAFVQIAGLIARRIVCDLEEGNDVKAGVRFGIIRFGSRVDVYLPLETKLSVCQGQTVIGGETIIANLKSENSTKELKYEIR